MKNVQDHRLSIGQLAKISGHTAATLRYYEKLGLLQSLSREPGGARYFPAHSDDILTAIAHFQALGFTLREVLRLRSFPRSHNSHRRRFQIMLRSKLGQVDKELRAGRKKKDLLFKAFKRCTLPSERCVCELKDLLWDV
jgi:MerR family copper efflux transcriptional regulator